jgi:hypothetical protein
VLYAIAESKHMFHMEVKQADVHVCNQECDRFHKPLLHQSQALNLYSGDVRARSLHLPFSRRPTIPATSTTPDHETTSSKQSTMASSAPKGWTDTEKVSASTTIDTRHAHSLTFHFTGRPLPPDHRQSWYSPVAGTHSAGRPYRQGMPGHARQREAES